MSKPKSPETVTDAAPIVPPAPEPAPAPAPVTAPAAETRPKGDDLADLEARSAKAVADLKKERADARRKESVGRFATIIFIASQASPKPLSVTASFAAAEVLVKELLQRNPEADLDAPAL